MIRVGLISTTTFPEDLCQDWGDTKTLRNVAQYFDSLTVIAHTDGRRVVRRQVDNVRYILLPRLPSVFDVFVFPIVALLIALAQRKAGIRQWSASDPLRSGIVAILLRLWPGTRVVIEIQGQLLEMPSQRFALPRRFAVEQVARFTARRGDVVRAVSIDIVSQAVAHGVSPGRIVHVPSRCDTQHFSAERWQSLAAELRECWNLSPERSVVGFLGSLHGSKGIDVLLAASQLASADTPLQLVVAGDGPLIGAIESAAEQSLPNYKVLPVGYLAGDSVAGFLALADIVVVPSVDEGLPRVVLESMAMERAVVASRVGGIPDAIQHGVSGLLVPPGDIHATSQAIAGLLPDNSLRERLGRAAREQVVQRYDARAGWAAMAAMHGAIDAGRPAD